MSRFCAEQQPLLIADLQNGLKCGPSFIDFFFFFFFLLTVCSNCATHRANNHNVPVHALSVSVTLFSVDDQTLASLCFVLMYFCWATTDAPSAPFTPPFVQDMNNEAVILTGRSDWSPQLNEMAHKSVLCSAQPVNHIHRQRQRDN